MSVGAWGDVGDVFVALLPIFFVVALTVKSNPPPPTVSLPLAAALAWLLRLSYFRSDPNCVNAAAIASALGSLSVISIIYGAVALFATMEITGCLRWISMLMKRTAGGHPVAEAMLIGWGFVNIVEGASGFGTPVALGSPILIELGHSPLSAISATLVLDALCTNFGAVGTPVWFGLGQALANSDGFSLSAARAQRVGLVCACLQAVAALVVVPTAASLLSTPATVRKSLPFVWLATLSVSGPSVLLALWDYEFSTLGGGLIGFPVILLLIHYRVGLREYAGAASDGAAAAAVSNNDENDQHHGNGEAGDKEDRAIERASVSPLSSPLLRPGKGEDEDYGENENENDENDVSGNEDLLLGGEETTSFSLRDVLRYTFPLTGSVAVLVLTRVRTLGVTALLTATEPALAMGLGTLGTLRVSASLVVSLDGVLGEGVTGDDGGGEDDGSGDNDGDDDGGGRCPASFSFQALYQPFILPFVVVSLLSLLLHRRELERRHGGRPLRELWGKPFLQALDRCKGPAVALLGAMALVGLLTASTVHADANSNDDDDDDDDDDERSDAPADIVGRNLSRWFGGWFVACVAPLAALGSFFSGSATVSNLTFGAIQAQAAGDLGLPVAAVLGLQTAAAASGNMICLGNIIAAKSVCGCDLPEGTFIRRTAPTCALHCLIITVVAALFLYS